MQQQERDQVSVFAFDTQVQKVAECAAVSNAGRAAIKKRITELQHGGGTDLFGGWLAGVNELATHPMPAGIQWCLILTDGQANHGETRFEVLQHHAKELRARAVSTSTFGVGSDFNQYLLEGMAAHGGGHYYFIEEPTSIAGLFQQEFGELLTVTARGLPLTVTAPAGIRLGLLGDVAHESSGPSIVIPVGDLFSGSEHLFCLEANLPIGGQGSATFPIEVAYRTTSGDTLTRNTRASFTYDSEIASKSAPRDQMLRRRAADLYATTAEARALRMADEAAAMLLKTADHYADRLDPQRAAELRTRAERIRAAELSPHQVKEAHMIAYNRRYTRK